MPDQPTIQAPPTPPFGVAGVALSHLDIAASGQGIPGIPGTTDQAFGSPALPPDFDIAGLEAARANDQGQTQQLSQQPQSQTSQTPPAQREQPSPEKSPLQWKQRPSDARKESQASYRKGLEQRIAELQAQLNVAQPNSTASSPPASMPTAAAGSNPSGLAHNKAASQQPAAASTDITQDERYKKIAQERDEYLDYVKTHLVEKDPEFRARFDTAREAAIKMAKSKAGAAADDIAKILSNPDAEARHTQLAERIKDFSEGTKASIMAAAGKLTAIDVERGIEIESRKQTFEMRQKQEAATQQQERAQRETSLKRELDVALSRWRDPNNGMPFALGEQAEGVIARANDILFGRNSNYTNADLADDAIKAAVLPEVLRFAEHQAQEIAKYERLMQQYRISLPGEGMGGTPVASPAQAPTHINDVHGFMVQNANLFADELQSARQRDAAMGAGR